MHVQQLHSTGLFGEERCPIRAKAVADVTVMQFVPHQWTNIMNNYFDKQKNKNNNNNKKAQ